MNPPPKNNIPIGHVIVLGNKVPVPVDPEWMRFFQVALFQQLTEEIAALKSRVSALEGP